MNRLLSHAIFSLCLILILSCQSDESSNNIQNDLPFFSELKTNKTGIDFVNALRDDPNTEDNVLSFQHYFNGAGVGIGDFNKDGLPDVFLAGNEVKNKLFINQGELKFEDITENAGINVGKFWSSGVSIVDINNDGWDDIYVCQSSMEKDKDKRANTLYINNKDLTFTESAKNFGLDDLNASTQAVFFDYDRDGDLDCYILNESKYVLVVHATINEELKNKQNLIENSGKFLRNDNGRFVNITEEVGMLKHGYGLGVVVSDFNGDNWPDVYVANDYSVPDFMYINQKDGTFKDGIKEHTSQISFYGMGCDAADINNDGLVDISVVDMAADDHIRSKTLMASMDSELFKYYVNDLNHQYQYMFNSLQLNNGNGTYSNIVNHAGVAKTDWSWANLLVDLNMDGLKDYYVTNGFRRYSRDNDFRIEMERLRQENGGTVPMKLREEMYYKIPEMNLPNLIYINDGKLGFKKDKRYNHPNINTYSYGAAYADFDLDGDLDLVVNNIDQQASFLKNNTVEREGHNFVKIKLNSDKDLNPYGAKVSVHYANELQFQEYNFVRGYQSSMEQVLTFGLGHQSEIDRVEILWPNDKLQIVRNVPINELNEINYDANSKVKQPNLVRRSANLLTEIDPSSLGLTFIHKENEFEDFEKEVLLPHKQSTLGPALSAGDVNNDGLDDLFIGGAKSQRGTLYLQSKDGSFSEGPSQPWEADVYSEDLSAQFIDANSDGNLDLVVTSGGGGEYEKDNPELLKDRFYANLGGGNFAKVVNVMPNNMNSSYGIFSNDLNKDGDIDLIVSSAAKPGFYPTNEGIFLYDFDKTFIDKSEDIYADAKSSGLIKDMVFTDLDKNGFDDIIMLGEWTGIKILMNENGEFTDKTDDYIPENKNGWWYSISMADLDNDGDNDFVLGNMGTNYKQKAKKEKPLYLFANDFDDSGTIDVVLGKKYKDKIVPTRGKECSSEQMPYINENFPTYKEFAHASIEDILGEDKIKEGQKYETNDFSSYLLWNNDGELTFEKLPEQAQLFPIMTSQTIDINHDGDLDIVLAGNIFNTEYETPRMDSGYGLVLINNGKKEFSPLSISESGLFAPGNVKRSVVLKRQNDSVLVVANNNGPIQVFSY